MHDVAIGRGMMVVVEEGWWWAVRGRDVAYGDRSGVHEGDVLRMRVVLLSGWRRGAGVDRVM